MLINYKTFPALKYLSKEWDGRMHMALDDMYFYKSFGALYAEKFRLYSRYFKHEINIISKVFSEAAEKHEKRFVLLLKDIAQNDISDFVCDGCFIWGDFVHMIHHKIVKGSERVELAYFLFERNGFPAGFWIDDIATDKGQVMWINNHISKKMGISEDWQIKDFFTYNVFKLMAIKMFKTFSEVEEIEIEPRKKKKVKNIRYFNQTDIKVTHLDCTWFTTLIRTDGFKVSGHFRLQPCGDGMKDRKLIWINDFEKHGYTRRAQILVNKEKDEN